MSANQTVGQAAAEDKLSAHDRAMIRQTVLLEVIRHHGPRSGDVLPLSRSLSDFVINGQPPAATGGYIATVEDRERIARAVAKKKPAAKRKLNSAAKPKRRR